MVAKRKDVILMVAKQLEDLYLFGEVQFRYISRRAGIAQLVEHNLAKVGVAGSSPVSRSE